jgi:hypothetical protein
MSRITIGRSFVRILPTSTACQSRRRLILSIWPTAWINPKLFPNGSPVARDDFPFFSLCGTMSQSLASENVWENKIHMLVYESPK